MRFIALLLCCAGVGAGLEYGACGKGWWYLLPIAVGLGTGAFLWRDAKHAAQMLAAGYLPGGLGRATFLMLAGAFLAGATVGGGLWYVNQKRKH